jgi:replicative DNA helicase
MDAAQIFQAQDEQYALACLLEHPDTNRWELDGLTADLFTHHAHRQVAEALIEVRNSGRRVHWRRVRRALKRKGQRDAWDLIRPVMRAVGSEAILTATMSRLVQARATRRAA